MSFNISYSPISLMGALAQQAGETQAAKTTMSLYDAANAQQTAQAQIVQRSQAFRLQQAAMQQSLAANRLTPAASHIQDQATTARQERQQRVLDSKKQLDSMLSAGQIDPTQYSKAILGIITGDEGLINNVLKPPGTPAGTTAATTRGTTPTANAQLDVIRRPHHERRRMWEAAMTQARTAMMDHTFDPTMVANDQKVVDGLQGKIDQSFTDESNDVQAFVAKATKQGQSPMSANAPDGADLPRDTGLTDAPPQGTGQALPMPSDKSLAVVGQLYQLRGGKVGKWNGQAFEVQ